MYYACVNWYDDYRERDMINHIMICAADWNDAMQKITEHFTWINSIEMEEVDSSEHSVVFLPENLVQDVIAENRY